MQVHLDKIGFKVLPRSNDQGDRWKPEQFAKLLIVSAFTTKYQGGIPKTESKIYARLQENLDDEKASVLDAGPDAIQLIVDTLEGVNLHPNLSHGKWALIEALKQVLEGASK